MPTRVASLVSEAPDARPAPELAVILPAYNEIEGIEQTLTHISETLRNFDCSSEVIVVDDGSTDGTGEAAAKCGVRVLPHLVNRGYGAALKTGILSTTAPIVVIMDADSSYLPEAIPVLYAKLSHADMVVGARALSSSGVPWIRRPAKWFLNRFAGFLVGCRVPDLNSGQRVMKRDIVLRYLHLMPNGFSFTSTITLALLANGHPVIFEPVTYTKRSGHSKIHAAHFLGFLLLVVRSTVLFNPLKVFLPIGALLFLVGLIKLAQDLWLDDLSDTSVMVFLAALIVWALGLLADMVSRLQIHPPWPPERVNPPSEASDHALRGPRLPRS